MWSNANSTNIVQTPNYNLDCYKLSTGDKIIATKNVNTMPKVDAVLKLCWHQTKSWIFTLCWRCVEKFGVYTIYEFVFYHYTVII